MLGSLQVIIILSGLVSFMFIPIAAQEIVIARRRRALSRKLARSTQAMDDCTLAVRKVTGGILDSQERLVS